MGMKVFDQKRVRMAEAAQLLILHSIFSLKGSADIVFQGGTAIRWVYGGIRFSEDLDFVTGLSIGDIARMLKSASSEIRNNMIANFGPGEFSIIEKTARDTAYKSFINFLPASAREKIAIKIEFEKLRNGVSVEKKKVILGTLPSVLLLIREGELKIPVLGGVADIETEEEILSDKVRALLQRQYIKGRDFFDIWFLTFSLNTKPNRELIRRKLEAYEAPFTLYRDVEFFTKLDPAESKEIVKELDRDLGRFLTFDQLQAFRETGYRDIITAVRQLFRQIHDEKIIDQKHYRPHRRGGSVR
jgi:predicted nucleotidyltransferase component of viral defense system